MSAESGFGGVPIWAVRGAKIVAIKSFGDNWRGYVQARSVYVVRDVVICPIDQTWGFYLEGIIGQINQYLGTEYGFVGRNFRPVISEKDDLEAHFYKHPDHSIDTRIGEDG